MSVKRFFFILCLATLAACVQEEFETPDEVPEAEYNAYLIARIAGDSKATVSDDYTKLSWAVDDTISVYTSKGRFVDFVYDVHETGEGTRFKGVLEDDESIGGYAVYPNGNHKVTDGELIVSLPERYEWEEDEVNAIIAARISDPSEVVTFNHLGGVFAFDVTGMPAGASSFSFSTSRIIKGTFPVSENDEGILQISTTDDEVSQTVTFDFAPLDMVEDMKFFVPVPAGAYPGFTVTISSDEKTLNTKTSSKTNTISRTSLKKFSFAASEIIYVTVDGEGDGTSWTNATTLDKALTAAEGGAVIRMAGGTYVPETLISGATADGAQQFKTFLVNKHITIQGSYDPATGQVDTIATPTVISGQLSETSRAYHAMVVAAPGEGVTVLKGLTFTKGYPLKAASNGTVTVTSSGIDVLDYRGGGLYVGSDTDILSCVFVANEADAVSNTSGTAGVGMYVASGVKARLSKSTFSDNVGGACGGAIYVQGELRMSDCLLSGNKASHSGAVHNAGNAYVDGCVFSNNEATTRYAGALRHQGTVCEIANTAFVGNKAVLGGAVHNNRKTMSLSGCTFTDNTASEDGGAVANWGGGTMTLDACAFTANTAADGGAVSNLINASTDSQSQLTVNKCSFVGDSENDDNDASYGGALVNKGSVMTVSGCSFDSFKAEYGGALANVKWKTVVPELTLEKGCRLIGSEAKYGGALANLAGNTDISSCDFESNDALTHGGAIYNAYHVFTDAEGAVADEGTSEMTITYTEFISNTSVKNGGAVMNLYAEDNTAAVAPKMTISNCEFIENQVTEKLDYDNQGGAIANQCSVLSVSGTTFRKNYALHSGAVYSYDCSLNTSTALSDKVAYTYIYNSCFDSNTVGSGAQGSHFRSHGKSMNLIVNSTFWGGNSKTGAIRLRTGATCHIVSCTIYENATGLYNQSSVMKVYNTISYGNDDASKHNYKANQADSEDLIYSSLVGQMAVNGGRSSDKTSLFDSEGNASDISLGDEIFGTYKDGVYPVTGEPALSGGMTNAELSALATEIKTVMPDLEDKYFTRDQKNSPRSECEKVMGAYIGDVYLDPNRDGYINNTEIDDDLNLRGLITDDSGAPVSGVAVSDGYDVVLTDANGVYNFAAHQDSRYLSISVPAAYKIPYKDNRPDFWRAIDPTDYEIRNDFKLTGRTSSADDFTIFSVADIHVGEESDYTRFSTETMADLSETVSAGTYGDDSFAIILGDIVDDDYSQVENIKAAFTGAPVPVFPCFGNHDCSSSVGTTEIDLISKYQQHFGPVDYSFNIGKAHVVVMKNMIYEGNEAYGTEGHYYTQGFLDHQVEWLKKDLAAVTDRQLVILCVHIPLKGSSNTSKNYKAVIQELLTFQEAHVLSGHHHGVYNHIPSSDVTVGGKTLFDHNQVAASGAWWSSNLNPDGSPNGYMIYEISGSSFTGYEYKAVGQDSGYQMRVYDGGSSYSAPFPWWDYSNWTDTYSWSDNLGKDLSGKFVVHVFNADTRDWEVNFVQNGVSVPMTRAEAEWYDVASYAFASYYTDWTGGGSARYSYNAASVNFWYIDAPSGTPSSETGWYVEAVHKVGGKTITYTSDTLHSDFSGFEYVK